MEGGPELPAGDRADGLAGRVQKRLGDFGMALLDEVQASESCVRDGERANFEIERAAHPKILAKMITHRRYTDPDYLESVAHEIYGGTMRHNPTAALTALRQQSTSHNGAGYVMQLTAGLGWTSVPFLPRVKAPTLVMSGNDDPLIPSCNARIIAGLIPNSELNIFEGGHLALVTEADVHAPEVEAFLDRIGD